jgi:hypothetical protein
MALVKPLHSGDPDMMSKTEQHLQPCSLIEIERLALRVAALLSHRGRTSSIASSV